MTSPRQKEIKKVMDIRLIILGLIGAVAWGTFLYLWVWRLDPWQIAGSFGLTVGLGFSIMVFPLWRKYGDRLDRLLKYSVLFGPFFEAMITEMESNDEEKGDSWLMMEETELRKLQNRTINKLQSKKRTLADDFDYQKELANYCAMVWLRGRQPE